MHSQWVHLLSLFSVQAGGINMNAGLSFRVKDPRALLLFGYDTTSK